MAEDALTQRHTDDLARLLREGTGLGRAQGNIQAMIDSLVKNGLFIEYVHMADHTEMRICRREGSGRKMLAMARVPYSARRAAHDPDAANVASLRRLHELAVLTYRRDRLLESTRDLPHQHKQLGTGQLVIGNRVVPDWAPE